MAEQINYRYFITYSATKVANVLNLETDQPGVGV